MQRRCSFLTPDSELLIQQVPKGEREALDAILEKSFDGWYLRHSKKTLRDIEIVFAAKFGEYNAGLIMLKKLDSRTGYVYYVAVSPEYRGMKVGSRLLDHSISYFDDIGINIVFASLTEHEEVSNLFKSRRFLWTSFGELSKKYGRLRVINMYRKMLVVTGEVVVYKELAGKLTEA